MLLWRSYLITGLDCGLDCWTGLIQVQPTFGGGLYNQDCNSDWCVYTNLISLIQIGIQFKRLVAIHIIMTANDVAIPGSERIPPFPTGWPLRHHVTSHLRSQPENKMFCTIEVKIDDSRWLSYIKHTLKPISITCTNAWCCLAL